MKTRILTILLSSVCISSLSCAQSLRSEKASKIIGNYSYTATDSLSGIRLELNSDGHFKYSVGSDMQVMHSYGNWVLQKDTLTLNSSIDKEKIPVSIKEEIVDSLKEYIQIALVSNLDGEIMEDATLNFNNDTTTECIPLFGAGCNRKIGSVDNLCIRLNNGISSKWIRLKSKKANLLKITVDVHGMLGSYLFLVNQKYLYKNGNLYVLPITQITELDIRNGGTVKREIILQKKLDKGN